MTLHEIEVGTWGWAAVTPGFGYLSEDEEFAQTEWFRAFELGPAAATVRFAPGIEIPIQPFAGVMGVAPATDERLSTIPPRANGGNMDNRHLVVGTTVYFPVFVPGGLFSIGDLVDERRLWVEFRATFGPDQPRRIERTSGTREDLVTELREEGLRVMRDDEPLAIAHREVRAARDARLPRGRRR